MGPGHRQEVRSSWEVTGSQSQGLVYAQPAQGSLNVSNLCTNGLSEGNVLQARTPSFSHSALLPGPEQEESCLGEQQGPGVASCNLSMKEAEAGRWRVQDLVSVNKALGPLAAGQKEWLGPEGDSP